jgi:hypothetical protein
MRLLVISLTLLFAAAAAAQNQSSGQASAPEQPPVLQQNETSFTRDLSTLNLDARVFHPALRIDPQLMEQWRAKNAPCYTMRSYLFDRRNGFAPELVGMTTCTPARDFQLKRTEKPPTGGLVPLTWPGGDIQK